MRSGGSSVAGDTRSGMDVRAVHGPRDRPVDAPHLKRHQRPSVPPADDQRRSGRACPSGSGAVLRGRRRADPGTPRRCGPPPGSGRHPCRHRRVGRPDQGQRRVRGSWLDREASADAASHVWVGVVDPDGDHGDRAGGRGADQPGGRCPAFHLAAHRGNTSLPRVPKARLHQPNTTGRRLPPGRG